VASINKINGLCRMSGAGHEHAARSPSLRIVTALQSLLRVACDGSADKAIIFGIDFPISLQLGDIVDVVANFLFPILPRQITPIVCPAFSAAVTR